MSEIVEVSGDMIYVIDRRVEYSAIDSPHLYDKIDWLELAKQKRALVRLIWDHKNSPLWGLVHLLDHIQDDAEIHDYPVVYGYDLEMYKEDHPNAEIPDGKDQA